MNTKYYISTLITIISFSCFSACATPFKLDLDYITKQNRAKVIRLFAYDNFTAMRQDSTILVAGRRKGVASDIEYIFNNYKCLGDNPTIEESYINSLVNTYEANGVKMQEYIPIHLLILSCKDSKDDKKIEVKFIVEGDRWLILGINENPRVR